VGISRAAELGVSAIAMPTNGNAGAAWSAYAARAGMRSLVVMPAGAPVITRAECAVGRGRAVLVDGHIGDAGSLSRTPWPGVLAIRTPRRCASRTDRGQEDHGPGDRRAARWRLPGVIVYPTGGGVGIIGTTRPCRELLALGWVSGDLPRLVAVQAAGCAADRPGVPGRRRGERAVADARTVAFGITVPNALGRFSSSSRRSTHRRTAVS